LQRGAIFGDKGPAIFDRDDDEVLLLVILSICNSAIFKFLVSLRLARTTLAQSYEAGIIQSTPFPNLDHQDPRMIAALSENARGMWTLRRRLDLSNEVSHAFVLPFLLLSRFYSVENLEAQIRRIQDEIDSASLQLYGIKEEDFAAIQNFNEEVLEEPEHLRDESDEVGEKNDVPVGGELDSLLSWSTGVAIGRFDIRFATGERAIPPEPEPFDPLPARSPGMVPDGEPAFAAGGAILVDDPGHRDDLALRVRSVYEHVAEPAPDDLRLRLARSFFPAHIKMYSKSRRKAPIYWQLATPSASYSVWLYIHAFTKDTLYQVQNDYAAPKLQYEARRLETMRSDAGPNPGAKARREIAAQESFVDELRTILDEVNRVTPLWNPDLDDGVIINFAPLWRLVPQHKAWQREVKAAWDALCAGDYDWAHLAMHLWPERVVVKCASDRSLAIAHGLEEVFWDEGEDGKGHLRVLPLRPVEELVRERSSPAVKAALQSLLEAPVVGVGNGRVSRRTGRGNRS
jgi:hypothetical protein